MSLNIQASDWVPQTLPKTPIQFGNPQYLACTIEAAVSAWQWIWCKQQECTSKRWRCHWAAAPGFFLGMAAAPHFLQRIWNCSAKLDLALTYLEMQNRLKQIRLGEWGCKAGAWEGKRLTAVQACSVFGQLQELEKKKIRTWEKNTEVTDLKERMHRILCDNIIQSTKAAYSHFET